MIIQVTPLLAHITLPCGILLLQRMAAPFAQRQSPKGPPPPMLLLLSSSLIHRTAQTPTKIPPFRMAELASQIRCRVKGALCASTETKKAPHHGGITWLIMETSSREARGRGGGGKGGLGILN